MIRKTLTIVSLIGLLLSVGAWGVSYWEVDHRGRYPVSLSRGCWVFGSWWDGPYPRGWSHSGFSGLATDWIPGWNFEDQIGMSFYHGWSVWIPFWIPTSLSVLAASFLCLFPNHRRRKRKKLGLCVKCGYDLRASKDRCPECGTEYGR